jgi:hypothetical protein
LAAGKRLPPPPPNCVLIYLSEYAKMKLIIILRRESCHKFVDLTFVKALSLLYLFFREKKRSLGRRLKVLILAFNKYGTQPGI